MCLLWGLKKQQHLVADTSPAMLAPIIVGPSVKKIPLLSLKMTRLVFLSALKAFSSAELGTVWGGSWDASARPRQEARLVIFVINSALSLSLSLSLLLSPLLLPDVLNHFKVL